MGRLCKCGNSNSFMVENLKRLDLAQHPRGRYIRNYSSSSVSSSVGIDSWTLIVKWGNGPLSLCVEGKVDFI